MQELKNMVGQMIVAYIPIFHRTEWQQVRLLAIENSGIWVESQKFMNDFFNKIGATMSPKTMIFFLPFTQIGFIAASLDAPSISDKAMR